MRPVSRPTTFHDLVEDQDSIAESFKAVKQVLAQNLQLLNDVAEMRGFLVNAVGPGLQKQEGQIRHLSEKSVRTDERLGSTLPALELPRLATEATAATETFARLEAQLQELLQGRDAHEARLVFVEKHVKANEAVLVRHGRRIDEVEERAGIIEDDAVRKHAAPARRKSRGVRP
jgi:DNA repair exonuclease SbcCD ATPase subunit